MLKTSFLKKRKDVFFLPGLIAAYIEAGCTFQPYKGEAFADCRRSPESIRTVSFTYIDETCLRGT